MLFIQGKKYLLQVRHIDNLAITKIADEFNLSFPVAKVLYSRGYSSSEQIRSFLFGSLEQDVAHASKLKDGQKALERILLAIDRKEKILVSGDYDVDGVTSSALMMSCLLPLGANINFFLPHRQRDGYGLSSKIVKQAAKNGYSLIVTVDNGITALDAANTAKNLGIDLIITDHHRPHGTKPIAHAIVNPNQDDCSYPFKGLCGVSVIFKLVSWIYEMKGLELPVKAYELVMLGTVADVMPLLDENRFWVTYGLALTNKEKSYAMQVLSHYGKVAQKPRISSLDVGFSIAPQINALGRLSDPRDAVKFLISSNSQDVDRVGKILWEMNEARKKIERDIYDSIESKILSKTIDLSKENIIAVSNKEWPSGVIGLVAGKLMHNFGRPTFLFHESDDGQLLKGSCRSIKEFNVFNALDENRELLLTFGGHSFAAGLSLLKKNLPELKARLEDKIAKTVTPEQLQQKLFVDSDLELLDVGKKLVQDLERLEPFGHQNEQPLFLVKNVSLLNKSSLLKEKHVKCTIFSQGVIKPVIFFNRPDIFQFLENNGDSSFHIVGNVTSNFWNDRESIELQGIDVALDK